MKPALASIELDLQKVYPLTDDQRAYQQAMLNYLEEWQIPDEIAQIARLLPWCNDVAHFKDRCHTLPEQARRFITDWRELKQMTSTATAGVRHAGFSRSRKLRRLMRIAYLNLPLVMVTVADHAAEMISVDNTKEKDFWHDTEEIFLPLLRMLGLWELRRDWVELSAKNLYAPEFEAIKTKLENKRDRQEDARARIQQYLDQWEKRTGVTPEIKLHPIAPGRVLYHNRQGEALDDMYRTLIVSVYVNETSDCYRILEPLHQIGIPIQNRLSDHIAQPHSNGYQAIHTTLRIHKKFTKGEIQSVSFRIFSREMDTFNMWGVVADKYQQQVANPLTRTWWREGATNGEALSLLQKYDVGDDLEQGDDHIYVFTPQGDIRLLNKDSNALDFAYRLHTDMGNHCQSARVNGQAVRHEEKLANGDLVQLHYNPNFAGPEPAWLHIARDPYTRIKIKQGLGARQNALHPGRARINKFLDALAEESGFVVPEPQLEKYFEMAVRDKGLANQEELFDNILSEERHTRIPPEYLISYILESELVAAVLDGDGQLLGKRDGLRPTLTRPIVRFCPYCKPAPGSDIVLHRKRVRSGQRLTLHRYLTQTISTPEYNKRFFGIPYQIPCIEQIPADELDRSVHWGEILRGRLAANITVMANDRSGLVGDVLSPIYMDDRVTLSHVEATADIDGHADIWLTVESDNQSQVEELEKKLENIKNVVRVSAWPVSPPQAAHLRARHGGRLSNPYTANPVDNMQMLFGREKEIQQLRSWLERERPERLILVHGEKRAGKTSLVRLARTYLRGPIRAIYMDLLFVRDHLKQPGSRSRIYQFIAKEIEQDLTDTLSEADMAAEKSLLSNLDWSQEPGGSLVTYLRAVEKLIHPQRLVIILDEFNVVVDEIQDDAIFTDLRALTLGDYPWLTFLLVTHSSQTLTISPKHPVWQVYQQSQKIEVPMLNLHSARKLVEQPTWSYLKYQQGIVNHIVVNTNGHPFLINLLCRDLVQCVSQQEQHQIARTDLQKAEGLFLRNGLSNFHFAIEKIADDSMKPMAIAIAQQQYNANGKSVNLAEIAKACAASLQDIRRRAKHLELHGILSIQKLESDTPLVGFTIPYFYRWINEYWADT